MNTKFLINASATVEILTGIVLLAAPRLVIWLLFESGLSPVGVGISRLLGIGLIALGVAVWERRGRAIVLNSRVGLGIYNIGAAIAFIILDNNGDMNGIFLWPAIVLHMFFGAMIMWAIVTRSRTASSE